MSPEAIRIVWFTVWGLINVTCFCTGVALLRLPDAPGGAEWPIGIGPISIGAASTIMWARHIISIYME